MLLIYINTYTYMLDWQHCLRARSSNQHTIRIAHTHSNGTCPFDTAHQISHFAHVCSCRRRRTTTIVISSASVVQVPNPNQTRRSCFHICLSILPKRVNFSSVRPMLNRVLWIIIIINTFYTYYWSRCPRRRRTLGGRLCRCMCFLVRLWCLYLLVSAF